MKLSDLDDMTFLQRALHNLNESIKHENELHIFDFDETLAWAAQSEIKVYFGYYMGKGSFDSADRRDFKKAMRLLVDEGIVPVGTAVDSIGPHMILDFHGYELLRQNITKSWRKEALEPAFESRLNYFGYDRYMSIKYEFADPSDFTAEAYSPLPAVNILKERLNGGADCYILTARGGEDNRDLIEDFLLNNKISLPKDRIIAWGSSEKGEAVYELITRHQPSEAFFYDDGPKNIAHVKQWCCGRFDEIKLHLIKYQRGAGASIGEVDFKETCGGDGLVLETTRIGRSQKQKRDLNRSRRACSRLRRLSGLF